ncbi:MAG: hypothetical protein IKN69_03965 [Bacilli bacterium]|nr:hypothetical protein [Bacilli bacterium]
MAEKKISLPVVNLAGEKVGDVKLSAEVFGITEKNEQAIHDAVVAQSANARQATAKTRYFDLQGREIVNNDRKLSKGIYLVNGKKVIMK